MSKGSWLYTVDGKTFGPVSSEKIAKLVLEDVLDRDSSIQSSTDGLWKKLGTVNEIVDLYHKPVPKPILTEKTAKEFQEFVGKGREVSNEEPIFFNVSWKMMLLLTILTGGFYEIYWFVRQWFYINHQRRTGRRPYSRISVLFFVYDIFDNIERDRDLNRALRPTFSAKGLAFLWYGSFFGTFLINMFFSTLSADILSTLITLALYIYVLVPVQRYINEANKALGRTL